MARPDDAALSDLSLAELRDLVARLLGEMDQLRAENQALKDEIARLKGLPPRPPKTAPSGMEQASRQGAAQRHGGKRRRGSTGERLTITQEGVLRAEAPVGSRFKGYEDVLVQDLHLAARVIRYRRERWLTPAGQTVVAALPAGIVGGFGPELRRFVRAGHMDYVVNTEALAYMRARNLALGAIDRLAAHEPRLFPDEASWRAHLQRLGLDRLEVAPDPVRIASEGALWGAIRHHGLLDGTVIVSDEAGQFRVGTHALCWVHAERLVHKLMPVTPAHRRAVEIVRHLIWWFYRDLKAYYRDPTARRRAALRARFNRIFRRRTGYIMLDRLLARLYRRKRELLRVLEHPEIPLHTNGSENDIRAFVTKRKISGGTVSEAGRRARDVLLGLMKTCGKLGVSFFGYLGDRLGVPDAPKIAPLPDLVRQAVIA